MAKIHLKRPWGYAIFCNVVLFAALIFIIWSITYPAIEAWRAGKQLPADWTWTRVVVADIVAFLMFGILIWLGTAYMLTEFSDEGVKKPRLWGQTFIKWSEVKWVYWKEGELILKTETQKVQLNPNLYSEPEELARIIRERVPPQALTTNGI
jgi:hypothetical protein